MSETGQDNGRRGEQRLSLQDAPCRSPTLTLSCSPRDPHSRWLTVY